MSMWDDYAINKTEQSSNPDDYLGHSYEQVAGAGAIGSLPGSQTDGQGAGITPTGFNDPSAFTPESIQPAEGAGAAGASTPTGGIAAPAPAPAPSQPTYDFDSLLNKIQTATDPQQAAIAQDQLSRQLYQTLSEQGHDVKWDGDQLMVDGRPYVVGGQATAQTPSASGAVGAAGLAGSAPQAGWWAPNQQGFIDWAVKTWGNDPTRDPGFVKLPPGMSLEQVLDRYRQETGNTANFLGGPSGDRVDFGQGVMDTLTSGGQIWGGGGGGGMAAEGGGGGGGYTGGGGGGGWTPPATPSGPAAVPTPYTPGNITMPTWTPPAAYQNPEYQAPAQPNMQSAWEDTLRGEMGQARPDQTLAGFGLADPMLGGDLGAWRPQGGGYVPGDISLEDVQALPGYEQLLARMSQGQEGSDALMAKILANPESLGQQTTDTMKAQMKDTLAAQQQQEEEDLKGFGAASGIGDSGWLASERASSRRGRDMAAAKGAGDIDIEAARTNMADRRAAAGLGLQAGEQKRANVQAASNAALQKSAAIGDRLGLRESVKQEAAKLRISEDQVMSNFVQSKQDALLKKYGVDLGASVDLAKLNEQSKEFREDLMQKMASLEKSLSMQKYGIDTSAATSKYGTDVGSATSRYGTDMSSATSRYGTDVGALLQKYGIDVGAATSRYGTDVGAGSSKYGVDVNARLSDAQREQQDRQFAASLGLDYDRFNQLRDQDQWKRMTDLYQGGGAGG